MIEKTANVLIFAGTTEGRLLAEAIEKNTEDSKNYYISTATEYGGSLLPEKSGRLNIMSGIMEREEISAFADRKKIDTIVDATHPYADIISENLREISGEKNIRYIRLLRKPEKIKGDVVFVKTVQEAVEYLSSTEGNVLLTTGSKDLEQYTQLRDYRKRIYSRILPTAEMVKRAENLGFDSGHLICMQGPFSCEINTAMLKHVDAEFMVTKESGKAGGFSEKLQAAEAAGAKAIVIGRPSEEKGMELSEVLELLGLQKEETEKDASRWFPMFTDISKSNILVVGGGKIATRRIRTLSKFQCTITVVAKELTEEATDICRSNSNISLYKRAFVKEDIEDKDIVIAATSDEKLNLEIKRQCSSCGIPVNVAHKKEECDFYFPGIVVRENLVVGVCAEGKDHRRAAQTVSVIDDTLGRM